MKTHAGSLIIFLFFLIGYAGIPMAQVVPVDEDTKLITYKEVVQQEGAAAKHYNQCISWINSFYENPFDATRVRDADNGKIEIRHRFKVFDTDKDGQKTEAALIDYTLTLEFKENRYRYIFSDFNVRKTSKFPLERWLNKEDPQYVPACEGYLQQVDESVKAIIKSLKAGMVPKTVKPDEW